MRSAFIFTLLTSVAFSSSVKSCEAALQSRDEIQDEPKQDTNFIGSEQYFGMKVNAAIKRLYEIDSDADIDPASYYDAKTVMLNLAEEVENYNVSGHGKFRLDFELKQKNAYLFPNLDEKANKKCGEPTYDDDDDACKHFNFESFAKAVKDFEIRMYQLLNRAKVDRGYFRKSRGKKEYDESETVKRELALLKQDKWDKEKTVKQVNDSWKKALEFHESISRIWNAQVTKA